MAESTLPKTRGEAKALGIKRYFSGKPCPHGHVADRLTSNGTCVECSNERLSAWSAHNREKLLANLRRHIAKDPEGFRERQRANYEANRDKVIERAAVWSANNQATVRKIKRRWKKNNLVYCSEWVAKRRARARAAKPKWADLDKIAAIYAEAARLTAETGIEHHVDHKIPLNGKNVCGLHVEGNLQILTKAKNLAKCNKFEAA